MFQITQTVEKDYVYQFCKQDVEKVINYLNKEFQHSYTFYNVNSDYKMDINNLSRKDWYIIISEIEDIENYIIDSDTTYNEIIDVVIK